MAPVGGYDPPSSRLECDSLPISLHWHKMEPLSELKSESDKFVACRFIQLSYKGLLKMVRESGSAPETPVSRTGMLLGYTIP